jgi:hypothetical protein
MSTAEPTPADTDAHAKVLEAEHELEQATSGRPQDPTHLAAALEQAVDACRRWPEAASGVLYLPELLGELSEAYEQLGRTEDALDTMRAATTAGYTGAPDPRCRLAEILLRAGRAEEAHPIFGEVKAETPDDVWLYNNAGLEYGAAGDHERALEWLTEGAARPVPARAADRGCRPAGRLLGRRAGRRRRAWPVGVEDSRLTPCWVDAGVADKPAGRPARAGRGFASHRPIRGGINPRHVRLPNERDLMGEPTGVGLDGHPPWAGSGQDISRRQLFVKRVRLMVSSTRAVTRRLCSPLRVFSGCSPGQRKHCRLGPAGHRPGHRPVTDGRPARQSGRRMPRPRPTRQPSPRPASTA